MLELTLRFQSGTLVVDASELDAALALPAPAHCVADDRVRRWRAPAAAYREVVTELTTRARRGEFGFTDAARGYGEVELRPRAHREPRPFQREAVDAWFATGRRGLIVLPTGAGKSHVAHMVMERAGRSALIVVPTIDLMNQWYTGLLSTFDYSDVGLLGGGSHDLRALTVSTYDSLSIHADRYGDRFGLVIFDECHHLGGPSYLAAARALIAPFRLGLTATPERQDGRHELLDDVVGPTVYRRGIRELAGEFLADYDVERVSVALTPEERVRYDDARATYTAFTRKMGIGGPRGWGDFVMLSSRSREGRRAMKAYREYRRVALACEGKLALVERLLVEHSGDRIIIFTNDNDTVYTLSRMLLVPALTHQTPAVERRALLERFRDGRWPIVVTSKVLNEGVDVPDANVAIVLSGSGSVREHVQRLGRVLRQREGKRALLYEVVTEGTVEEGVSERRRDHDAYR